MSTWAPPMVGGPQNLYNLFSCVQPETFAILTSFHALHENVQSNVQGTALACEYYYYNANSTSKPQTVILHPSSNPSWRTLLYKAINSIPKFGPFFTACISIIITVFQFTQKAKRIAPKIQATHLLGISDTGPALLATYLTHRNTKIPYSLYLFDLYKGNLLPQPYRLLASFLEPRLIRNATTVLVTNEVTEKYYKKRYGINLRTEVIHNSTFPELFAHPRSSHVQQAPYTIIFTGNIYWAQEQAVINMIDAMSALQDLPISLKLYCPKPTTKIQQVVLGKKNIWLGAAGQAEMPSIQSSATLLFLPLAWNTRAQDIVATATPGKFTDYLASGRPMLIHAPNYAYVSAYSREHNLGLVVDQNDPQALAQAIREFLKNTHIGEEYVANALRIFHKNHDARKNAKKLTEILNMV